MSQENVEIVRRAIGHFERTQEFSDDHAHDFVFDLSNFGGWPEQQAYRGAEEAQRFLATWTSVFGEWQVVQQEIRDAGDDRVFVLFRQSGRASASGVAVELLFGSVFTLRDGRITRLASYTDWREALKAVGLSE